MISYLPPIYPDELVYSWFCRYYVHSGCFTHKMALDDILYNPHNNPSKEFLGHLNPSAQKKIQSIYSLKKLVLGHTMLPQYARFLSSERKKNALYHLTNDFCDVHQLFSVLPRTENDRFLKYCPACVVEDRKAYGETYWHRFHQIRNLTICPRHQCLLERSTVLATSAQNYTLCPAENYAVNLHHQTIKNDLLLSYSKYLTDIFNAPYDIETDISIKQNLQNVLKGSSYLSSNGKMRFPKRLADDLKSFYLSIGIENIASFSQIQKVLNGDSFDFFVVCQISFYLQIPFEDLLSTKEETEIPMIKHHVKEAILDWKVYDTEIAPKLEKLAKSIYTGQTSSDGRPERLSERLIYQQLNLSAHRLEKMPQCQSILKNYSESYEENWARRIIWAYQKLKAECPSKPIFWSDIRALAGVKKHNIEKILPFLKKHAGANTYNAIIEIIQYNTKI